ncbi:MAG: roadblock/LC7 domain-containing protein [Candidatus Hodarchaeales archaeon]|jgi:predicted regulator of Ras-like GTPase activity (Roadblock/LC7/MglB family)
MSVDVSSIQTILRNIIASGAKIAVLSDKTGLPIAVSSTLEESEQEEALSAVASLIMSLGDTISREIEGNFTNATVRTETQTVLAVMIPGEVETCLTTISPAAFEQQVLHEITRFRTPLADGLIGIATEIIDTALHAEQKDIIRIKAFFATLADRIAKSENAPAICHEILTARDNLYEVSSRWSTVGYRMNKLVRGVRNTGLDGLEILKKDIVEIHIREWEEKMLAVQDES